MDPRPKKKLGPLVEGGKLGPTICRNSHIAYGLKAASESFSWISHLKLPFSEGHSTHTWGLPSCSQNQVFYQIQVFKLL